MTCKSQKGILLQCPKKQSDWKSKSLLPHTNDWFKWYKINTIVNFTVTDVIVRSISISSHSNLHGHCTVCVCSIEFVNDFTFKLKFSMSKMKKKNTHTFWLKINKKPKLCCLSWACVVLLLSFLLLRIELIEWERDGQKLCVFIRLLHTFRLEIIMRE